MNKQRILSLLDEIKKAEKSDEGKLPQNSPEEQMGREIKITVCD